LQLAPTPAARPLSTALQLLAESFQTAGISVEQQVADPLPTLEVDADRLHQVFVNLLGNARDALTGSAQTKKLVKVEVRGDSRAVT